MCDAGFVVLRFRKFVGCGRICQGASGRRILLGRAEGGQFGENIVDKHLIF